MGKQKRANKKIVKSLKKATTDNVFKVAGAKSLKAKSKAKAKVLTVQLKKLQTDKTAKVAAVNEELKIIQKEVISPKKTPKKQTPKKNKKAGKAKKGKDNAKLTKDVTVSLDTMKM